MKANNELMEILENLILEEHSKAQMEKIVAWVGSNQARADLLVEMVFRNEKTLSQRASWPLGSIAIAQPKLVKKHLPKIVAFIQQPKLHAAIKRHMLRFFETMDMPEELQGPHMDHCFRIIENPDEAIACKASAMGNLHRLSLQYPEIIPEIKSLIEARIPFETAAFKARAKIFYKK